VWREFPLSANRYGLVVTGPLTERRTVVKNLVGKLRRRDEGASAVEYGLLVALIAVVIAAGVTMLGQVLNSNIQSACSQIGGSAATCAPSKPS
jgi:pilus assembly protein Flp/PilA